jgi:hypothetical protein
VEQHFDLLFDAREIGQHYQKQAEHFRQIREAKRSQLKARRSLKQHIGQQLIAFGRKLAQDTNPAFE